MKSIHRINDKASTMHGVRGLEAAINRCKEQIVSSAGTRDLRALFVGGSFHQKDRNPNSDLDIIAIASDTFPEELEPQINELLAGGSYQTKCKMRSVYLSELQGGRQRGFITKLIPVRLIVRCLQYWPLIWGPPIDPKVIMSPYAYEEEALVEIELADDYVREHLSAGTPPFDWILKIIMYICAIEAVLEKGSAFTTSFSETEGSFSSDRSHIVHQSMRLRRSDTISVRDRTDYLDRAVSYLRSKKSEYLPGVP